MPSLGFGKEGSVLFQGQADAMLIVPGWSCEQITTSKTNFSLQIHWKKAIKRTLRPENMFFHLCYICILAVSNAYPA